MIHRFVKTTPNPRATKNRSGELVLCDEFEFAVLVGAGDEVAASRGVDRVGLGMAVVFSSVRLGSCRSISALTASSAAPAMASVSTGIVAGFCLQADRDALAKIDDGHME